MLHDTIELLRDSGLLDQALNALRGTATEAVDAVYQPSVSPVYVEAAVAAADQLPSATPVSASTVSENACDIYPNNVEAEAVISDVCDGSIQATMQVVEKLAADPSVQLEKSHPLYQAVQLKRDGLDNLSYQAVVDFNKQLGLYDPTSVKESAALMDGTTFTLRDDGTFVISDPKGNPLITVDCDGKISKFQSISMFDSKPCVGLACVKDPEPVVAAAAPAAIEEPVIEKPIRVREQVYWCADDYGNLRAEEVLIFDSVEDAERYMQNPGNIGSEYQEDRKCPYVWIANGEGSVQRVEFIRLSDGSEKLDLKTLDSVGINDGKADYTPGARIQPRDPLKNLTLSDGEKFEKYITGYAGTSNVRADDGMGYGIEKGETYLPSAPQEYVRDPETGAYVREDLETSATRTVNLWLREAGISGSEWDKIYDMRLPEEFADSGASIDERAQALIKAAAAEGVALTKEDATELTRIMTAGQGERAGFYTPTERLPDAVKVSARRPDGAMLTLDEVLFDTARKTSIIQRSF